MNIEYYAKKRILKLILIFFIMWDLGFSFYQHYHTSIGGDIAQIVIPTPEIGYYDVLNDPFGISVLKGEKSYGNPNRFFAHWIASNYLLYVPDFLQNFVQPIPSIYLSMALFKTLVQISLVLLLTYFAAARFKPSILNYLIVISIISSLFQTYGYNRLMGIIDQSVIYAFFYALSMVPFCIFLVPIIKWANNTISYKLKWYWCVIMILLSFPLALGGPLIPGVVLVAVLIVSIWIISNYTRESKKVVVFLQQNQKVVIRFGFIIGWLCLLCLYSLYVGSKNTLNNVTGVSLAERYSKIPIGLWELLTNKLGLTILVCAIVINVYLIKRFEQQKNANSVKSFKWLLLFIVFYILLLPLGGYREYRPNIVRYDTIIPVTLVLFYMFGQSSLVLLKIMKSRQQVFYGLLLSVIIFIFSNADTAETKQFYFEYNALVYISNSEEKIVELDNKCPIMEFRIVHEPEHSKLKAELLTKWNVTENNKLFFQKK